MTAEPLPDPIAPTTAVTIEPPPPEPVSYDVDLSTYSRACRTRSDCELVKPNVCSMCGCAREPIAKSEMKRFQADAAAITCPPRTMAPGSGCGGCIGYKPVCVKGTCEAAN